MVIKPGTHILKVRYWVKDVATNVEGTITKTLPSTAYASNTYYNMTANLNIRNYDGDKYYMWDAQQNYWSGHEWNSASPWQTVLNGQKNTNYAQSYTDPRYWNGSYPGYGLQHPSQVIDYLALLGDKVDNIPGCKGIGEKGAQKLLAEYGSVEELLAHAEEIKGATGRKLLEGADDIRLSYYLATIRRDVPIHYEPGAWSLQPKDEEAVRALFEELEFRTLLSRVLGPPLPPRLPPYPRRTSSPASRRRRRPRPLPPPSWRPYASSC